MVSVAEFSKRIKTKYPEYKDVDDFELATRIVEKYPEYKGKVDLKKKETPKEEIPVITLTPQGELPTQPAQPPTQPIPSPTKPSLELRTSGEVPAAPSPSASPLPSDGKFRLPEGEELDLNDPLGSLYFRANPMSTRERPSDISRYGAMGPLPLPEKADEKEGLKQKDYEDFKTLYQTDPTYAIAHLVKSTGKTEQEILATPFAQIDAFARPFNETDKISIQTLKRVKSAQRSSDPNNWLNGKWSAGRAAVAYASETDSDKAAFIRQYMQPVSVTKPDGTVEKMVVYGNPKEIFKDAEATLGTLVSNYLNDPINEAVAMSGPFAEQFKQAKKDFAKNYPKTAAVMVGNKISQAYEKSGERGYLSRFAQMNTPGLMKEMDELAKDLLAKGEMSQEEYDVYLNQVRGNEQYLDVPSVVEQIGLGGGAAFAGIKSTFTQPFTSTSKTQLEAWEEEASNVSANPKGFWKFSNDAAHMAGFVMGMSATGGILRGGQGFTQGLMGTTRALSPTAMNMTNAGLIFFGDNLKAGKLKYPNDPAKAITSAVTNTTMFVLLSKDLFPVKQVEAALKTVKPEVDAVVNQLTSGAITREAYKVKTRNIFTNTLRTLSAATKQNVKASSEMAAISLLDRGLDKLMGLDKQKFDQYHGRNAELEAFTNMFMGNAGVAAWAGYGKMRYKNRAAIESYYDAAKRPNFYRKVVSEGEGAPEAKSEILENIKFAETLKAELEGLGMSESKQKAYIANAMAEKVMLGKESADPNLQKKNEQEVNEIKKDQEELLKNPGEEIELTDDGFVPAGEAKPEVPKPEKAPSEVKINDVIDRTGTYKGQKGRFYLDGQQVIFDVEGSNKEYVIGSVGEIGDKSITEFGVEAEGKVVETNEAGNVVVRGEEFVNLFSDPTQAINRNKEGEVISVNLETADGKKRTFRGDVAKDIAAEIEQGRVAAPKVSEGEVPAEVAEGAPPVQPAEAPVTEVPPAPQPKTIEQQKVEQDAETERLVGGEADKNRKAGKYVKDGVEYVRNESGQGEYSDRKGEVRFTNEVAVPFRYKLVEAETLQPSHSGGVRNPNHFIPEAQPKSRLDKGSIMAEEGFANNPRFEELGENTNAFSGAPVVNQRNEVVQGNNRAAGLKKGYERNNPAYKEALKAAATKFGFSPSQVEGMKNPVLVREVAVSDAGAIELGNYDVKDLETGGKRRLDPIAVTRRMSFDNKKRLAEILFGAEGTLNEAIRGNVKRVMEILNPFLNQAQRNTLMNKEGNLTEAGAKDLEAVVQQLLFDNGDPALPDLFENLSQTQKEGLRKALPHIFAAGADKNLVKEVQNAILALNDFASSGSNDFGQWLSQTDMFKGGKTPKEVYTPLELKIAEVLNDAKSQKEIKLKFQQFEDAVKEKEATMFEPAQKGKSKEEAVKEIFQPEEVEAPKAGEVAPEVPQPTKAGSVGVGGGVKPKTKVKETKVYHFTDENISDFDESKGGVWLTTNSAGYPLKRGLKNKVERTINEKELNFATDKQVFQAGGGDYKKGLEELKKQGYDGVKRTVDGDKEFYIYDKSKLKIPDERKAETTGKRGGAKVGGEPKGEVPTAEGGEPAKPTEKGKYTKKAEQIAKEIMKAELPSWLKGAELPPGTEKMGPSLPSEEAIKKALANAVIKMGKLLDRGVEFSQAVKEATRNLVKLVGEDKAKDIQNNFTDYYNQRNAIPKQTAGEVPIQPKAGVGEKVEGGTPGAEPKKPTEKGEGKGEKKEVTIERKKAFLNAIINAKGTPKAAKEGLEERGLKYQTKSQKEAADLAESIIASQGIDAAVEFAEKETLDGDVNALVMMKALEKLSDLEAAASSPAEKQQYAIRFSEIADAFDNKARSKGRFNSAINYFYKKSPLGIVINENNKRKERFEEWASERTITGESKEQSWKDFYENIEEVLKDPTVAKIISERIAEGVEAAKPKAEAKAGEVKPEAKAGDPLRKFAAAIRKGRISKLGGFKAGTGFDAVWDASVEVVAKAVEGGATLADAIQAGLRYVRSTSWYANLTNKSDFDDKFREHFESEYAKEQANQKKAERYLNNLKKKLSGLSVKERDAAVKRAFEKIVESGGLDYQEFRDIIGEVTGRGSLTDAQAQQMKDLVDKTNAIEAAAERVRTERTPEALKAYRIAELEAAKATAELQEMLDTNPNIFDRLTSIMQLNTLGIPSLINNPIYNIWNQATVRYPIGLVNTLVDQSMAKAFKAVGKNYVPETNILNAQVQAEFFKKLGFGAKESFTQLLTGLNRQDYIQKELTTQKIQPLKSLKSLYRSLTGKEKLTKSQKIDKALQATVGLPAEIVARVLNLGDKPQRFAAEAATASTFAQQLGLKDIDYKIFIEFPREEAYRQLRNQGLSEAEASQRADYIKEAIIKEGKRSTFQQDNILNDMLNSIFSNKGFRGTGNLIKSIAVSPYIKIPANAYWSYYNMVNPEVALIQSMIYGARSAKTDGVTSKMAAREAKYWFGHAVVGVATRAVVLALVQQGIFNPGSSKEETKKEREGKSDFIRQGTIDIDKLSAVLRGDNPDEVSGGTLVPLKYLGHWGTIGNTIAKKYEEMIPEQRKAQLRFWDAAIGGMELDAVQELQEGIFSNTSSLLSALQDDKSLRRYGMNVVNLLTNIVHPAAVAQVERAALPYQSTVKADNFMDELKNNFLQRSFFLRKILDKEPPAKIGIWGDQLDRKENLVLRWFGISKENKDNFAYPIWELVKKTGDIGYFPPAVLPRLNDQELTVKQTSELQELVGKARKVRVAPYLNNQAEIEGFDDADGKPLKFKDLNDDIKKFVLNYLYELGRVDGVYQFYLVNPGLDPKNEFRDELDEELKARKAAFRQVNYYKGRPEEQLEKMMEDRFKK